MKIIKRSGTECEFFVCEGLSAALSSACISIPFRSEIVEMLEKLLSGDEYDEELYQRMAAERLANLSRNQHENLLKLSGFSIRKELKRVEAVRKSMINDLINRRRRQTARISQGDEKSIALDASLPVPPTMMKGGLHYATEAGV